MRWKLSDGFCHEDFDTYIAMSADASLTDEQKRLFVSFECSAASKALTLGLDVGQTMVVTNIGGTNAVTVKAIKGDNGTSVAAGKTALCIGSATANASKIIVLNADPVSE